MGDEIPLNKLKVAELKALAKDISLPLTGKEKKNELHSHVEDALDKKLSSLSVDELKILANQLQIVVQDNSSIQDYISSLKPSITGTFIRNLFNVTVEAEEPVEVLPLEEIGADLVDIETDLENVIHKLEQVPAADMADIYVIDQKLTDVVKMNIDYSSVASMLDIGRIKFLDRKYIESMAMLSEAVKASGELYRQYSDITQAFIILSAEKILEECRESKSNNEKAADALIHAKRSFSTDGTSRIESINTLTEIANTVYREEVVFLEERMAHVEPLISAMKVQGVDIFNAERYLHRARESFLVGELSSVNSYLDKSLNNANDSKNVWVQEIRNDIPRVESILIQASELGADISDAEKHLSQAKMAFENQDYSLCSELKKLAERKAMESQHIQIQKAAKLEREKLGDAEKILVSITPLLREAEAYGINTFEIAGAMQSARNALMNNDYVNALTFARDAESRSKPIWTQVKAQRESIMSRPEQLQHCQTCNSIAVKVLHSGKAVCVNCGIVYDIQVRGPEAEKKGGWFKKK